MQMAKLQELMGWLNPAVLVPVPARTKACFKPGWNKLTTEVMSDPAHLEKLRRHGNCGALMGTPSADLVGLDIDYDHHVEPFLKLNPPLRHTFSVRGGRGLKLLMRMNSGAYPRRTANIVTVGGQKVGQVSRKRRGSSGRNPQRGQTLRVAVCRTRDFIDVRRASLPSRSDKTGG